MMIEVSSGCLMVPREIHEGIWDDKNVVDINAPEYREFVRKDPLYAFNYLRTERIARIIYEHIDKNAEAAGVLARKIYDSKSKVYA